MFETSKEFAAFINGLDGNLWLVGGAVRDKLMGKIPNDFDYMITGVDVSRLPFERVVGDDFPVFLVEINEKKQEVAMARAEKKNGTGHKGFTFWTDSSVTVEEDLARRDLTINAMAEHVLHGRFVDPFDGRKDLKNGILRHVSEAFVEDPLRVFRIARFSAMLGFEVAEKTKELMRGMKEELRSLPVERVWKELGKALSDEAKRPSKFFTLLKDVDVLDVFFPEVAALDVADKHDGTAFLHTMKVLDVRECGTLIRFGLLTHDFGKGLTDKGLLPAHHGHDKTGPQAVERFCDRLKVPKDFKRFGMLSAAEHMRAKRAYGMRPGKFLRWKEGMKKNFVPLALVSLLDSVGRESVDWESGLVWFRPLMARVILAQKAMSEVTGDMLLKEGMREGKVLGDVLFQRRVELFKELENGKKGDQS